MTESEELFFPLPPEYLKTTLSGGEDTVKTIGLGDISVINNLGLRTIEFSILLPSDSNFAQRSDLFKPPIYFLSKFREIMANKESFRLIIMREMPDGSYLFNGNLRVVLDKYNVLENHGGVGDYYVNMTLREYREAGLKTDILTNSKILQAQETKNESTSYPKSYTVKSGDSLWSIAKANLGDGSRYKEIAGLNGITDYNNLSVGTILNMP